MDKSVTTRKYYYIPKTATQGSLSPDINTGEATLTLVQLVALFSQRKNNGQELLACIGCKQEFPVHPRTTAYRCYKCHRLSSSISGSEQSRRDSRVCKHDLLNNANTRMSPSAG